jgi:hypothetical protein
LLPALLPPPLRREPTAELLLSRRAAVEATAAGERGRGALLALAWIDAIVADDDETDAEVAAAAGYWYDGNGAGRGPWRPLWPAKPCVKEPRGVVMEMVAGAGGGIGGRPSAACD